MAAAVAAVAPSMLLPFKQSGTPVRVVMALLLFQMYNV
jgi:hypothetical protein